MTGKQKIVFGTILAVAAFLIFFRLGRADLLADDAHYATRALGYFDYMSSAQQTTPVQWFGERPWWSYLSFHDHPPLFFFVQHIFFELFGDTVAVSRLTSAFAALGSVVVIFFLGRRFGGVRLGLLAMGVLTANNYFIWQGRIGLLESLMVFWLLLGLLYLIKGLEDHAKYFVWSGAFFGVSLLGKYSFLFALPAILVFLLWRERWVFQNKKFWLGIGVFLILATPLLIYNLEMYWARGHFDVQLADLAGQSNADWPVLGSRVGGFAIDFVEPLTHLGSGMSWPYFAAALISFFVVGALAWRKRQNLLWLPLLICGFMTLFLVYVGGASRWLGVIAPFASLTLAIVVSQIWRYRVAWVGVGFLAVYCLVYIFNTNHALVAPKNPFLVSPLRKENLGFNQLDKKLTALLSNRRPTITEAEMTYQLWLKEIKEEAIDFPVIRDPDRKELPYLIVYDANLSWFPMSWVFDRWRFYNRFFVATSAEFAAVLTGENTRPAFDQYLRNHGVIFIKSSPTTVANPDLKLPEIDQILEHYTILNIEPEIVRDDKGREAFYIYDDFKDRTEP